MRSRAADVAAIVARALHAWRPPAQLSLSAWAEAKFVLSAETAAEPGRWHTLPYQREILDAISDPRVEKVTWMKSARVGYTLCLSAAIGYFIDQEPSSMLVVQPTIADATGFSKETIAPMLRDVPALAAIVFADGEDKGPKDSSATLMHKSFPGGILSLVGANSGTGFRRISRRVVMFDEVDAYPPSAGAEGDPIKLGMQRAAYFHNRKIIAGSTPLVAGSSRIEEMFEAGDRRRYYVPCPQCGHMDVLRFRKLKGDELAGGHRMRWPDGHPEEACFECGSGNGCVIEEQHKLAMLEAGEWRAEGEFTGHASFHLWAAYSLSPNAAWGQIATEFVEAARGGVEKLRVVVNTLLGETWKDRGDAPDYARLYARREAYAIGSVPDGAIVLTAGVDVQKDRFVYEVVGWAPDKENWSIDAGEIYGDTARDETWAQLDALLERPFHAGDDREVTIAKLAIDSGYNTQVVYRWARRHPLARVIACKGVPTALMIIGAPSPVDVAVGGRRLQRGYRVWPIGVNIAKAELYGFLGLALEHDGAAPPGYCHFPEYGEEYFKQITAEQLVTVVNKKTRRASREWHVQPNRENHYLDARILARAAVSLLGLDRMKRTGKPPPVAPTTTAADAPSSPPPASIASPQTSAPPPHANPPRRDGFFGDRPRGGSKGGWFGRRR